MAIKRIALSKNFKGLKDAGEIAGRMEILTDQVEDVLNSLDPTGDLAALKVSEGQTATNLQALQDAVDEATAQITAFDADMTTVQSQITNLQTRTTAVEDAIDDLPTTYLEKHSMNFLGVTTASTIPTVTQLPATNDFAFHYDTTTTKKWFAWNRGGVIFKIELV